MFEWHKICSTVRLKEQWQWCDLMWQFQEVDAPVLFISLVINNFREPWYGGYKSCPLFVPVFHNAWQTITNMEKRFLLHKRLSLTQNFFIIIISAPESLLREGYQSSYPYTVFGRNSITQGQSKSVLPTIWSKYTCLFAHHTKVSAMDEP